MEMASLSLEKATCNSENVLIPVQTEQVDSLKINSLKHTFVSITVLEKEKGNCFNYSTSKKFSNLADIMLHYDCNLAKKERSLMFLGESRER